jgi:predicted TIM-barrel fold metal-dependent hydrolase
MTATLPGSAATTSDSDRYLIISSDGHAGANIPGYKPYLASDWHDEFDAWATQFVNPFSDLAANDADRNWNSQRRLAELEADGVVAEVLYPNTVPPFFPSGNLLATAPTSAEYERRWAGLQAHNRWLADFCSESPQRLGGIAQILLHDVDAAVAEIRWAHEHNLFGGIMLPGVAPDSGLPPLFSDVYEPIWQTCAELGVVLNQHGGAGLPADFDMTSAAARAVLLVELPIWSHRGLWHLIFGGVFERHSSLRFVLTEQGTGWIPGALRSLDWFAGRMQIESAAEYQFGGEAMSKLSLLPSEYFERNCYVGASFIRRIECEQRHHIGTHKIMWGTDYPHSEGTTPYTREALRASCFDVEPVEMHAMLGSTAAAVYGFDLDALRPIADRVGPTVCEIRQPLDCYPPDSTCNAFDSTAIIRSW